MLLTLTSTHKPATDLGYLLHKHPARCQTFSMPFGQAHVFYPEASAERCTAALLLDVDPVGLVRRKAADFALSQYVNDRPYVASSFLSTAIAQVYGTALNGRSKDRPELVQTPIPLEARLVVVPCKDGPSGSVSLLHRLFEPLGYEVTTEAHPLDPTFPAWGKSRYYTLTLRAQKRLCDLLTHLYVLVPVLDDDKHYYVGKDEVEKLLRRGNDWLQGHAEQRLIVHRYLKRQRHLTKVALSRLRDEEDAAEVERKQDREEAAVERPLSLHTQRLQAVSGVLKARGAVRVLDLGCGEGRLLRQLLKEPQFREIAGVDVSPVALERAARRLRLDRLPSSERERITLFQGALTYIDRRLSGYDAAALVEVVEHIDPARLPALEQAVFGVAGPRTVVVTTPNAEYNVLFETLPADRFRHRDHRFEWTRSAFQDWAKGVCERFDYAVEFRPIGPVDDVHGAPTQMAIFTRLETSSPSPSDGLAAPLEESEQ